jgi:eukaryotic-like serine/threonine-protein kinase
VGYVDSRFVDTAVADPLTGAVLDRRYQVGAQIARGGMSIVYAGVDLRLDREVAIKVMAPGLARDPQFTDRFTREAKAAAKLSHINAVAVYDQGADDGHVFLVMELVRGRTLRDLLRERGRLSPELAASVIEPVLAVLAAAHRGGLVHRDVKPENVLLSDDGVIKVADFGLARAVAAVGGTQSGVVFGTAAYVAPEQVERGRTDPRSDVYSAGIVLWELLTGHPPYDGDSAVAVAYRHVHDDVPAPSTVVRDLPPALDRLVVRATRRQQQVRPADGSAFLAELEQVRNVTGMRRVPLPVRTGRGRTPVPAPPDPVSGAAAHPMLTAPTTPRGQTGPGLGGPGLGGPRLAPTAALPPPPVVRRPPAAPPARPVPHRTEQQRYRRRMLIGLLVVLLLGGVAGAGAWWYGNARIVAVPKVVGLTPQQAITQVGAQNLKVKIGSGVHSDGVRAGLIAASDPGAGTLIRRSTVLVLHPSTGPAPTSVPDVVGKSRVDALADLADAGLKAKVQDGFSDEPQDQVIDQSPRNTTVPRGTVVTVTISKGPDLVTVPDVRGESPDDAASDLEQAGLQVKQRNVFGGPFDRVRRQNPGHDRQVPRGSVITIDVF